MKESILKEKAMNFAIRIVKLYKFLCDDKKENVLSKQILRSGTSVGANINEEQYTSINDDCIILIKMLTSTIITCRKNTNHQT